MRFLSRTALICLFLNFSACSVWQSEGRKFLEKQAFEYTGAQAYLLACHETSDHSGWATPSPYGETTIFRTSNRADLRVVPTTERAFACDYRFASEAELSEQLSGAVENTWAHYFNP